MSKTKLSDLLSGILTALNDANQHTEQAVVEKTMARSFVTDSEESTKQASSLAQEFSAIGVGSMSESQTTHFKSSSSVADLATEHLSYLVPKTHSIVDIPKLSSIPSESKKVQMVIPQASLHSKNMMQIMQVDIRLSVELAKFSENSKANVDIIVPSQSVVDDDQSGIDSNGNDHVEILNDYVKGGLLEMDLGIQQVPLSPEFNALTKEIDHSVQVSLIQPKEEK